MTATARALDGTAIDFVRSARGGVLSCALLASVTACSAARGPLPSRGAPRALIDAGSIAPADEGTRVAAAGSEPSATAGDAPDGGLPAAIQLPERGCSRDTPSVRNYRSDDAALVALTANRVSAAPARVLSEGPVQLDVPAAWFAVRAAAPGAAVYRLRTGDDRDVVTLYVGAEPPVRLRAPEARPFRLALGPVAVRGAVWEDSSSRQRLEAIALLPCATPRFAHVAVFTDRDEVRARVAAMVRTLRIDPVRADVADPAPFVELDATQDRVALRALAAADPLAEAVFRRATSLRSRYVLTEVHPLADQWVLGGFDLTLAGARVTVRARVAIEAGRARAPRVLEPFREAEPAAITSALASLVREGCAAPAVLLAVDGVSVQCTQEPSLRASADEQVPDGLATALGDARHARATMRTWARDASVFARAPGVAALCAQGELRVTRERGALYVQREGCVAVLDAQRARVRALSVEGSCEALASIDAAWARTVREGLRIAERGANCRFSLGWGARGGYAVAAGDDGTTSVSIASGAAAGPSAAVDRRAVHTALAFVRDLIDYAAERSAQPPANTRPSVLQLLGLASLGTPEAASLLAHFDRRGGLEGAGVSAVLTARAVGPSRVEVATHALAIELSEEPAGWVVSAARRNDPPAE